LKEGCVGPPRTILSNRSCDGLIFSIGTIPSLNTSEIAVPFRANTRPKTNTAIISLLNIYFLLKVRKALNTPLKGRQITGLTDILLSAVIRHSAISPHICSGNCGTCSLAIEFINCSSLKVSNQSFLLSLYGVGVIKLQSVINKSNKFVLFSLSIRYTIASVTSSN